MQSSRLCRRTVLRRAGLGGAVLAALATIGRSATAQLSEPRRLVLKAGSAALRGAEAPPTAVWGFDGTVPGPVLRVRRGHQMSVRAINELPQPTTVHWHGVRLDNRMDGVPHLTQDPIPPGGSFDYRFICPDAGTFWYHPHAERSELVGHGLAGALIVDEDTPVEVDQDVVLLLQDWPLDAAGKDAAGSDQPTGASNADRIGTHATVNGRPDFDIPVRAHERVRLRLINAATIRLANLILDGLRPVVVAVDGQPSEVFELGQPQVTLPPGGRVDLMVDVPAGAIREPAILLRRSGGEQRLARFRIAGDPPKRPAPLGKVPPLPGNPLPKRIELKGAQRADLVIEGGAMAGGSDGQLRSGRPLVWTFNGRAGHVGPPLFSVKRGRTVVLALVNRSAWPHALHLHGHHARLLDDLDDGWKPWWLDTILIGANRTTRIAFAADNPGRWLLHCHRLENQLASMATWFEVL